MCLVINLRTEINMQNGPDKEHELGNISTLKIVKVSVIQIARSIPPAAGCSLIRSRCQASV